ncbi:MAG TPA: hypothetical protein VGQ20_14790 [Acidimicrobiales bacterium]|nr:hypothetical protein [Acidimicrobiales bacterium]
MAKASEFRRAIDVLADHCPADVDLTGAELSIDATRIVLTVTTRTIRQVIGRRGAKADEIRHALAAEFDVPPAQVTLMLTEPKPGGPPGGTRERITSYPPPDDPPPGGVREPSRPRPGLPPLQAARPIPSTPEDA